MRLPLFRVEGMCSRGYHNRGIAKPAVSLGGIETLVRATAQMSRINLTEDESFFTGVTDSLVRGTPLARIDVHLAHSAQYTPFPASQGKIAPRECARNRFCSVRHTSSRLQVVALGSKSRQEADPLTA